MLREWNGGSLKNSDYVLAGTLGLSIGILGGMVGSLLGELRLPALIYIINMAPATALSTNMIILYGQCISESEAGQKDIPNILGIVVIIAGIQL